MQNNNDEEIKSWEYYQNDDMENSLYNERERKNNKTTEKESQEPKKITEPQTVITGKGCLSIVISLLIIIFFIFAIFSKESPEITSGSCSSDMEQVVANQYKSPSTVKFISCRWDKKIGIYGEADAQNGFGATIRSSFMCKNDSCIITQK